MRRIYKEPQKIETDDLLNYLVALAVSNARFQDFDVKSKDFVDRALDLSHAIADALACLLAGTTGRSSWDCSSSGRAPTVRLPSDASGTTG